MLWLKPLSQETASSIAQIGRGGQGSERERERERSAFFILPRFILLSFTLYGTAAIFSTTWHTCSRPLSKEKHSMPNMTGRPRSRTMEMNGGSSAPYLACTPCVPLFVHCLIRVEAEGLLDYQGWAGIISIVRWNLRPVIFGVETCRLYPWACNRL